MLVRLTLTICATDGSARLSRSVDLPHRPCQFDCVTGLGPVPLRLMSVTWDFVAGWWEVTAQESPTSAGGQLADRLALYPGWVWTTAAKGVLA